MPGPGAVRDGLPATGAAFAATAARIALCQEAADFLAQPVNESEAAATVAFVSQLGDYRNLRRIGKGGMGVVYQADQISLRRKVAVKVLPVSVAWDENRLRRFQNESHAVARLHHVNIVPVYTVGCENGVHFFAMRYIEGSTLAEMIAEMRQAANGDSRFALTQDGFKASVAGVPQDPSADTAAMPAQQALAPPPSSETKAAQSQSFELPQVSRQHCRYAAELCVQAAEGLETRTAIRLYTAISSQVTCWWSHRDICGLPILASRICRMMCS